ncbi:MAG TPA: cell division topological specificity factor MinE [Clostridia bacterium]|nr:cell division topological specificity factor MinE [Clostridia bacterium]
MSWFHKATNEIAKERLTFILVQDRSQLSPAVMEQMKEELVAVIGKYFDIDKAQIELNVERQEGRQVVETSIPINGLRHQ